MGVIGGGQLAWMMASAAEKIGIELAIQTPNATDPAADKAAALILGAIDDVEATRQLAKQCDAITFENEFVNLAALSELEKQGICFRPRLSVLKPLLDKYHQRRYLREIGLPVPEFMAWGGEAREPQLIGSHPREETAALLQNWPVVMKARRHGYDGQGTVILRDRETHDATWDRWGRPTVLLEEFVPFERELAVMAARNPRGEIAIYPIVETQQEQQVCRRVLAPAQLDPQVEAEINAIARKLLESLDAVGIFGIELFLTAEGKVLVNEIAPRTHNSGHLTIDACHTSQFEMHLRAVCDLPLGNPNFIAAGAVMVNLLGFEHSQDDYRAKRQQMAQVPNAQVYWYGKTESRPGRKLGHVTAILEGKSGKSLYEEGLAKAQTLEKIWYSAAN